MRENMKFIVAETNKLLGRNYNVICFNALSPEELLQVLKDVLVRLQDLIDPSIEPGTEAPEQTAIYILSVLRVLNYQPQTDPATFRQGLIRGDPDTIHPILTWLLSRAETVRKRAYLSRFLVKVEVPVEYLGDPEVSSLYEQYTALIDQFKAAHKEREVGRKNAESASELTADLQTMEKEKEAVTIRIEKMKVKAAAAIHLLEPARALRMEREKERDLALQKEQERESLSRLQTGLQRLERDIQALKKDESGLTVQALLQHLSEVVTVQTIVLNEKLPSELNAKRNRLKALATVSSQSYFGPEEIAQLRSRLDTIVKEIQGLVELKISKNNVAKMEPFRQQAAAVANIKKNLLEKLEKTESSLRELQERLDEKEGLSRLAIEDAAPKGDEMKKYISRLKTRSTLYKHCKAELAALTAENSVLHRTALILQNQLAECDQRRKMLEPAKKTIPSNFTEENAGPMNLQLVKNITDLRSKLVPLINDVQQLRRKTRDFEERYDRASRSHNALESSMNESIKNLRSETIRIRDELNKSQEEKERLERLTNRMKLTEERIKYDRDDAAVAEPGRKIKEELNNEIVSEESEIKKLTVERENLEQNASLNERQTQMWNNIVSIFSCKVHCAEANKQADGIVLRRGGAETLVLQ